MKRAIGTISRYSDHEVAKVCQNMLPIPVEPASAISTFTLVESVPVRLASTQAAQAAMMNEKFDIAFRGSASSENPTRSQYSSHCCIAATSSYEVFVLPRDEGACFRQYSTGDDFNNVPEHVPTSTVKHAVLTSPPCRNSKKTST